MSQSPSALQESQKRRSASTMSPYPQRTSVFSSASNAPPSNSRSSVASNHSSSAVLVHHDPGYGSIRSHDGSMAIPGSTPPSSQREPTRSFFHSSLRGQLVPIDSGQNARSVREDTAELASYALSENQPSMHSTSPSHRESFTAQSRLESYFQPVDESDLAIPIVEDFRHSTIHELSEPVSPEISPIPYKSPGNSALADLIRRSPPNTSPPDEEGDSSSMVHSRRAEEVDLEGSQPHANTSSGNGKVRSDEETPLLPKSSSFEPRHPDYIHGESDLERQELVRQRSWPKLESLIIWPARKGRRFLQLATHPKSWDRKVIWYKVVSEPASHLPAVVLGCLLNILDALSYGMILFPLGQPIFEKLGPAGISMFYVSCIISQLVFSCGGSIFKGGIGSEMIEVVPFFHKMAFTIMERVGEDSPDAVIATTITAYALSSILTGAIFFLMGICRFGYIVGFIPRHILIGCIGGVGWFLVATGFEVTARLDGNLNYDLTTLRKMFQTDTVALWIVPLILAIILYITQKRYTSKYYLPTYILAIPAVFYFFVFALDELQPKELRREGWIFAGPDAGEPWWYFFTLYKFKLVHWGALVETIPAMFALTFFGVLHVPINVPALAFNVGEDNLNLDRELIAHGVSNALSGLCGSIQNYLVYTNSVLFIRSGGNSRLAGIMLAILTVGVLLVGPVIIGYIPVMMVGVLIFVLGFELFFEAVWEPRKKLKWLEYLTVIAIVLIMGVYDFVYGIFIGIGLAFVSLVVQTSRIPAVRASYSGEIAGSTVRRNAVQHQYLRQVGRQIHVTKLAGYLFFGTIVSVEERIRKLIDDKAFNDRPIRYLIFDLAHVTGIDYSAAEAFNRINRVFSKKGVSIVMSSVSADSPIGLSLQNVGLGDGGNEVKLLGDLNSALESCENELLKALYANKEARTVRNAQSASLDVLRPKSSFHSMDVQYSSPRQSHLHQIASRTLKELEGPTPRWQNFKEPLKLILQTFQGLTDKNEDFWFRVVPYFKRHEYAAGTTLYHTGQPANGFYLLEDGILRADYELPQGRYFESIVAGTTCGELPFFSETDRTATVIAERACITWLMDREQWNKLQQAEPDVAHELLRISLKLTSERMSAITSYVLTTAG